MSEEEEEKSCPRITLIEQIWNVLSKLAKQAFFFKKPNEKSA